MHFPSLEHWKLLNQVFWKTAGWRVALRSLTKRSKKDWGLGSEQERHVVMGSTSSRGQTPACLTTLRHRPSFLAPSSWAHDDAFHARSQSSVLRKTEVSVLPGRCLQLVCLCSPILPKWSSPGTSASCWRLCPCGPPSLCQQTGHRYLEAWNASDEEEHRERTGHSP